MGAVLCRCLGFACGCLFVVDMLLLGVCCLCFLVCVGRLVFAWWFLVWLFVSCVFGLFAVAL